MKKELEQTGRDLLYLIRCALHETRPLQERITQIDIARLFAFAKWHQLEGLTYQALTMAENDLDCEIMNVWKESFLRVIRKNIMLDAEREKLFTYMDKEGIWYVPLKGIVLKNIYPKKGMRQMADNDIWINPCFQAKIKDYFVAQGYLVESYASGNHDVYVKKPIFNFEMHTSLFGAEYQDGWYDYYDKIKDRLIQNESGHGYHFSDDDFYVYLVAHTFKHYTGSGTGIRSFVDNYVYRVNKRLDYSYINHELEVLGISAFEKLFRSTVDKLFGKENDTISRLGLSEKEYSLLCECLYAGTYGTEEMRIAKKLQKYQDGDADVIAKAKLRYVLRRIFPDKEFIKTYYPLVYRYKLLWIPFFFFRIVRGVLLNSKKLIREMRILIKLD